MHEHTKLSKNTIDNLQNLIEINLDSSKGLETAADKIENERIADYFRTLAPERLRFAEELKSCVEMTGEEPRDHGSVKGTMHRWWLNIKGTVSSGDEHTVLAEAEEGEDAIKDLYEEVLAETTESPMHTVLVQQYERVKAGHDTIRDMRDVMKKS